MKRAVITGGAGFLGSHLCDRLLDAGYAVVCLDNLLTGNVDNIQHLEENPRFSFVHHDVTTLMTVGEPVDIVFHFASPASPKDYLEMPIQTLKVGSLGTHNSLGFAMAKKARFLLASTSEVYGDPLTNPQTEEYWGNVNPVGPRGVYDEAKRFAEAMTSAYRRYHAVDTRIVRIFNTYGPRMRVSDGRVVSNFVVQALKGEPLTVYGNGEQTRSLSYVTDTIDGVLRLADAESSDSLGMPFNIGNPKEQSVRELAGLILSLTDSPSEIITKDLPEDDPKVRCPDISRAREALGWEPQVDVDQGLGLTIDYFRRVLEL